MFNGGLLKFQMDRAGLSVAEFCSRTGYKPHTVYRWLTNEKPIPGVVRAYILSAASELELRNRLKDELSV